MTVVPYEWVLVFWVAAGAPPAVIDRFHEELACETFRRSWAIKMTDKKIMFSAAGTVNGVADAMILSNAVCVPKRLPEVKLGVPCPGGLRRPETGQYYCPGAKKGRS